MAKESGITMTLQLDESDGTTQSDISNDVVSVDLATPRGVQDVTGLDKSAVERLLLLADLSIIINGIFNDAANRAHVVFKTAPSNSTLRTLDYTVSGQTFSTDPEVYITDYRLTRAPTGELTFVGPCLLGDGAVPTWS